MADDEVYQQKKAKLQQYIPFLETMIAQLKNPSMKNREQQLAKMESLHAMITDDKKKLKIETLEKCEDVIIKLYEKVGHNKKFSEPLTPASPASAPAGPSHVTITKPTSVPKTPEQLAHSYIPKVDIYSSAAESLKKPPPSERRLSGHYPDTSKPPISLEDLQLLEDDVQEKINATATLTELQVIRDKIAREILIEDIKKVEDTNHDINTTVRNNLSLSKKNISPGKVSRDEKLKSPKKSKLPNVFPNQVRVVPEEECYFPPMEKTDIFSRSINNPIEPIPKNSPKNDSFRFQIKPRAPVILKESASIFGEVLSTIDQKILGVQKKKDERRLSISGKDEKCSKTTSDKPREIMHSIEKKSDTKKPEPNETSKSNESDKINKDFGDIKDKSMGKSESSTEKKNKPRKEHSDKREHSDRRDHRDRKEHSDKKEHLDKKEHSDKKENTDKKEQSGKKEHFEKKEQSGKKERSDKREPSDKKEHSAVKDHLQKKDHTDKREFIKNYTGEDVMNNSEKCLKKDNEKSSADSTESSVSMINKIIIKEIELIKEQNQEFSQETKSLKRLADKYNPKPRKPVVDNDVDKSVTDIIEANMKISPPKIPVINQLSAPIPPPPSLIACAKAEPEIPKSLSLPQPIANLLKSGSNQLLNHLRNSNLDIPQSPAPTLLISPTDNFVSEYVRERPADPRLYDPRCQNNRFNQAGRVNSYQGSTRNPFQISDRFGGSSPMPNFHNNDRFGGSSPMPIFNSNDTSLPQQPHYAKQDTFSDNLAFQQQDIFSKAPALVKLDRFNDGTNFPNQNRFGNASPFPQLDRFESSSFTEADRINPQYNMENLQPLDYYPSGAPTPNNQYAGGGPPLLSPEVPFFRNEQKTNMNSKQELYLQNDDLRWRIGNSRNQWDRGRDMDQAYRGPLTYREYREMKQNQRTTRENKDLTNSRDPRETRDPRESRDPREMRDPRLNRDTNTKQLEIKDPRLNRNRDLPQSGDYRKSRYDSRFDKVYSNTNKTQFRSRSRSRSRGRSDEDSFTSPLDSLYSGREKNIGKGYGFQKFRIPRYKNSNNEKDHEVKENSEITEVITGAEMCKSAQKQTTDDELSDKPVKTEPMESTEEVQKISDSPVIVDVDDCNNDQETEVIEIKKEPELDHGNASQSNTSELSKELEPSKSTEINIVEEKDKTKTPNEQSILAQFFTNLLGSQDKKEKKSALYSLISTFSDSFSEKQLSKITKIIKTDDNESSSEEDEGSKKSEKTDDSKKPEDTSATELEEHVKSSKRERPKPKSKKRRISSPRVSIDKEEIVEETAPAAEENSEVIQENKTDGVVVSVGERIKSRKRTKSTVDRTPRRSELDKLHEDIQDMFIRDGVLTATGKRMCRLLKDDPDVLTGTKPESNEEPTKVQRKPVPKPKQTVLEEQNANKMKHVRVVIHKIPDSKMEEQSSRRLTRSMKVVESDEDESISENISTREDDSTVDSSDTEKDFTVANESNLKMKGVKRKRHSFWASGIIKRNKKKHFSSGSPSSEILESNKIEGETVGGIDVVPTKDFYLDFTIGKYKCLLCDYNGKYITTHYKKEHPQSEILSSRLSPSLAATAIEDSEKKLSYYESSLITKSVTRKNFACRVCGFKTMVQPMYFYDHLSTHTGEYRHACPLCEFRSCSAKTIKHHLKTVHSTDKKSMCVEYQQNSIIFGYMCSECNYVQMDEGMLKKHVKKFHSKKTVIHKINLSTIDDESLDKEISTDDNLEQNIETQIEEQNLPNHPEISPVPIKQKPGPKSKKKITKLKPNTEDSSAESKDKEVHSQDKADLPASTPKAITRRRSTAATLVETEFQPYVRSTRAAKEKAQEKLKSMMDTSENSCSKPVDNEEKDKASSHISPEKVPDIPAVNDNEKDVTIESKVVEEKPPKIIKKEVEMNVFTSNTDFSEENKKIEQERLLILDEVNKSIGSRTSLHFVDKLCDRLKNKEIKEEITQDMPSLEKHEPSFLHTILKKPTDESESQLKPTFNTFDQSIIVSNIKKPIFDEPDIQLKSSTFDVTLKNDSLITNVIEKLKDVLGPITSNIDPDSIAIDDNENNDNDSPPSLTHVNEVGNIKPMDSSTQSVILGGLVKVFRTTDSMTFCCLVPPCVFATENIQTFQLHYRDAHVSDAPCRTSTLCETCGLEIKSTDKSGMLENLFLHTVNEHGDFFKEQISPTHGSSSLLRLRRLSGDALSCKKNDSLAEVKEATTVPSGIKFNVVQPEEVPKVQIEASDDNPFPFKISGVMSLAEPPPPLTPIGVSSQVKLPPLVVVEAKMTTDELSTSKKSYIAMNKFLESLSDLYKCSFFSCSYSTNFRDFFENHLKGHKFKPETMLNCLYCDFKTPVEHLGMHIDVRHAHCKYACSYCLYRTVVKEYVIYHQDKNHPNKHYSVVSLPTAKNADKFAVADTKPDPKILCEPYRCTHACNKEFLYENEFKRHLMEEHDRYSFITCGYKNCTMRIKTTKMFNHWVTLHNVCLYQCGYCNNSSPEMTKMYFHQATDHPNRTPEILLRLLTCIQEGVELGYTDAAFKKLRRIVTVSTVNNFSNRKNNATTNKSSAVVASIPNTSSVATTNNALMKLPVTSKIIKVSPSPNLCTILPTTHHLPEKEINLSIENNEDDRESVIEDNVAPVEQVILTEDNNQIASLDVENDSEVDPLDLGEANKCQTEVATSDEECNTKTGKSKEIVGLFGYQLYRCAFCEFSDSKISGFRKHITSPTCRDNNGQYVCAHCRKAFKNPFLLADHIKCHGLMKVSCSLCDGKLASSKQAMLHMKQRHNVLQTAILAVNTTNNPLDMEEFVIKPKSSVKDGLSTELSSTLLASTYMPDQVANIPMKAVFNIDVKCGICSYSTKVRTNLIRHLHFHSEEKTVPNTAPVNPVPCLDKNEKMFDKMFNLASSSHPTSRMGGPKVETKDKDYENLPELVASNSRYVCCAKGCSYMCFEEKNLRHHLIALHADETSFTCVHCKMDLTPTDADNLIKHYKLHGLHLFKCAHCSFIHHLKSKVEKHIVETHLDLPNKVMTIRFLESENQENSQNNQTVSPPTFKYNRPWRCCMCQVRCGSEEAIKQHVLEKHEIDARYKCALCAYKSNDEDTFEDHFNREHDNRDIDFILTYRKLTYGSNETPNDNFDTTPLWQRDKPRVRHIRGILFDESTPNITKTYKKPVKNLGISPSASSSSILEETCFTPDTSLPSTSKSNLDISIDSVANGTADILRDLNLNKFVEKVPTEPSKSPDMVEAERDDDIIIIDDEILPSSPPAPKNKNKDSKDTPIAKNRGVKRQMPEVLGIKKIPKNDDIVDVSDLSNELLENNLKNFYGDFGGPLHRQLMCPICKKFKSKRISDIICHMHQEMQVYRFKCKICSTDAITYYFMHQHISKHIGVDNILEQIVPLPSNPKLEAWLQLLIWKHASIINSYIYPVKDTTGTDLAKVQCNSCLKWYKNETERNEHYLTHWVYLPYACDTCEYVTHSPKLVEKHFEIAHVGSNCNVFVKGPTVARELNLLDEQHRKRLEAKVEPEDNKSESNIINLTDESDHKEQDDVGKEQESDHDIITVSEIENKTADSLEISSPKGNDSEQNENEEVDVETNIPDGDLLIVAKTDTNIPETGDVYCCGLASCAYMASSEYVVNDHIQMNHPRNNIISRPLYRKICDQKTEWIACGICNEIGSEIDIRLHHVDIHKERPFSMYRLICCYCNKKIASKRSLKFHTTQAHPGKTCKSSSILNLMDSDHKLVSTPTKRYSCPKCPYHRETHLQYLHNFRNHLKGHFKMFNCDTCNHRFRNKVECIAHCKKEHNGVVKFTINEEMRSEFAVLWNQLQSDLKPVQPAPNMQQNRDVAVARKSTSAPHNSLTGEYSYYGLPAETVDLSKIWTRTEVNGRCLTMTALQLSKLYDINPFIELEKYTTKSDSNGFGS